MPKSSEKFGNRGMILNKGRGCLVGFTPPWTWPPLTTPGAFPPTPGAWLALLPVGGGGATIELCCDAALKLGGGLGGRGGPGGKGAWGGKGGPPGLPRPPMAEVGPRKGLFWLGMIVVTGLPFPGGTFPVCGVFKGGGKFVSGKSCSPETAEISEASKLFMPWPMLPKKPGACKVSDSMKKFWCGRASGLPSGLRAFSTNEHWVLQMLSRLTAS